MTRPCRVGTKGQTARAKSVGVLRFEHSVAVSLLEFRVCAVIVNLRDPSALALASGGCLSDGQGSQHNKGLLEQEDIPLIARWALWPLTTPTQQHLPPAWTEKIL